MKSNKVFSYTLVALEIMLLSLSFVLAIYLRYEELRIDNDLYYNYYLQLFIFMNATWLVTTAIFERHHLVPTEKISSSLSKLSSGFILEIALIGVFIFMMKGDYSRLFFLFFVGLAAPLLYSLRIFWIYWYRKYLRNPKRGRSVLLIGDGLAAHAFHTEIAMHPEYGYRIQHWEKSNQENWGKWLSEKATQRTIDEVFVSLPVDDPNLSQLYSWAEKNMIRFRYLPDLGPRFLRNANWNLIGDLPVLQARKEPLSLLHNRLIKRIIDIVFSLTAIVVLTPLLFPLIALAIKINDRGAIFFKQKRSGLNNQPFYCYKFRTLKEKNEHPATQVKKDDARVTQIGKFLRRHNLDELPQFFNVLKGDMSLVGPRPHMLEHTEAYRQQINTYMVRHYILPGLTGLAQVRGFRGPTTTDLQMGQRIENDVYYLENWSLFLDIKIIIKTIWLTIKGQDGAV